MDRQMVLEEIDELNKEGQKVLSTKWTEEMGVYTFVEEEIYYSWRTKTLTFLKMFLPEEHEYVKTFSELRDSDFTNAQICVQTLGNVKSYLEKGYISLEEKKEFDVGGVLERIFSRFYKVARQLRDRYNNKPTLEIEDEYDVQDLLHALLQLYFDDIRAEEWTPSYAGKCARVDFLLKNEKVVIEVKKTRRGLDDKELGDQLIIDVDRYKVHPDCERLVCFVYDPEGRIGNPNGIMADLNKQHEGFATVYIYPNM
ncbi:hypothetical protein ACTM9K_14025 [Bariatricus sp. HCP3S3_E12]|uniref:PD-(D/E)XK nuclease domain-containing protein n=1 Tax=Bariatricus sp. HCP3S3_E12 TaxID=3438906 RepID=UPI003F8ADB11